jgi:hypothetical protein
VISLSESAVPIVDYILVADFDIDKGSSLTFQYPQPTGEDAQ